MKHARYKYSAENELMYFEFFSQGTKGKVKKIIEFSETNVKDVFNLAFGDFDDKTQRISDRVVTNNGDSLKVLATVASSEEHTSELQSRPHLVCRLLLEKKKKNTK